MQDCIFCKIIEGTLPSKKVYENEHVVAFHDIEPNAPIHILIVPKKHIPTMNDVDENDLSYIAEIHRAAQQISRDLGVAESGYRLANNCGSDGGQIIYHLHYHFLAGTKLSNKMN